MNIISNDKPQEKISNSEKIISFIREPYTKCEINKVYRYEDLISVINKGVENYIKADLFIHNFFPIESYIKNQDTNPYYSITFQVSFQNDSNNYFDIYLISADNEGHGFIGVEPKSMYLKDDTAKYLFNRSLMQKLQNLISYNKYSEVVLEILQSKFLRLVGEYNNLLG